MPFVFQDVLAQIGALMDGAAVTVAVAITSILAGALLGLCVAVVATSAGRVGRGLAAFYVETFRNTPFLVQLFFVYFGLPSLGIMISAPAAAFIALTLNLGAYAAEIIRAGIESTHPSQIEAGQSLGLARRHILLHVVLLPALERVWPALSSQFILTMLATSIVSQISVGELTSAAALIESRTYRSMEVYLVAAGFYLALTLLFRTGFGLLGRAIFARRRLAGLS